jgi:hypothetical protein
LVRQPPPEKSAVLRELAERFWQGFINTA